MKPRRFQDSPRINLKETSPEPADNNLVRPLAKSVNNTTIQQLENYTHFRGTLQSEKLGPKSEKLGPKSEKQHPKSEGLTPMPRAWPQIPRARPQGKPQWGPIKYSSIGPPLGPLGSVGPVALLFQANSMSPALHSPNAFGHCRASNARCRCIELPGGSRDQVLRLQPTAPKCQCPSVQRWEIFFFGFRATP